MERQVHRCFLGSVGFAFVLTWATVGSVVAILAVVGCVAAMSLPRLLAKRERAPVRVRRAAPRTRPLRDEADDGMPLVPDDPSLVISVSG